MKRTIAILAALSFAVASAGAQIQVQTSHAGPVRALAHDETNAILISGGEDGKIKVWDLTSGTLRQSIQISDLAVHGVAIHPHEPQIAVVQGDGVRRFTLSVWDWQRGQRLFSLTLPELPIFLDYSPQGTFLVYSQTDVNSLRFISAQSGRSLPYLRRSFGIVTFATVAASEERIMTYTASSGSIVYWEIASGRQIQAATTETGITSLQVLVNRRFAAGQRDDELVVVDILDGTVRDRYPLNGIEKIMVNRVSGEIAVLLRTGQQAQIAYFTFERNQLNRRYRQSPAFPALVTDVVLHGESLYVGNADGDLYHYRVGDRLGRTLAENRVQPITGFAATNGTVHISTSRQLISLRSDLFDADDIPVNQVQYLDVTTRTNPLQANVGLSTILHGAADGETVVLWDSSGRNPVVSSYEPASAIIRELPLAEHRSIRSFHAGDGHLLLLHNNNSLRKISLQNFETVFSYSTEGMETAVAVDNAIVIGKSRLNPFDSALMRIDTRTGETVRIETDSFLVFDIAYDRSARLLYTLGLQQTGSGVRTAVTVHRGDNFQNRRIIRSFDGEDLDAGIAIDPRDGRFYTTMGRDGVMVWDGRRTASLPVVHHIPRDLYIAGRHLFSINRDGSMSVWNVRTRQPLLNIYLFNDGEWAVVTNDGRYFVPGRAAERHLSFVPASEREARRRRLEDFRLVLPARSDRDV